MSIVRLRVWDHERNLSYILPRQRRTTLTTPSLRLIATLLVGPDPSTSQDSRRSVTALLDTGSPFNVIDKGVWESWEMRTPGLFEPLRPIGELPPFSIAGGTNLPYRLGRILLGVRDENNRIRLPAVNVIFQMLDRPAGLPHPIILGMYDGILDGRWLRRVPNQPRRGAHEPYDCGSYYGQQWYLQDEPPKAP